MQLNQTNEKQNNSIIQMKTQTVLGKKIPFENVYSFDLSAKQSGILLISQKLQSLPHSIEVNALRQIIIIDGKLFNLMMGKYFTIVRDKNL